MQPMHAAETCLAARCILPGFINVEKAYFIECMSGRKVFPWVGLRRLLFSLSALAITRRQADSVRAATFVTVEARVPSRGPAVTERSCKATL